LRQFVQESGIPEVQAWLLEKIIEEKTLEMQKLKKDLEKLRKEF
jgi:hypothetical protein